MFSASIRHPRPSPPSSMMHTAALLTDLYELTMAQGYFASGRNPQAVFEMFFRRAPFGGSFAVFAGLEPLLEALVRFRFSPADCEYLSSLKLFSRDFLDYLAGFRFSADVQAVPEGSLVFPNEPLLTVKGNLIDGQLVESIVLTMLNYPTLIATKAARVKMAGGGGEVIEFGLRRAPGPDGALSATRAAYIGGADATSNLSGGRFYGIPVRGTMAHSWVKAFGDEREAFAAYARRYPDGCVLLIDTYHTLREGLPHAIEVGSALKASGHALAGVRLDSGNLLRLSRRVRRRLDLAGLGNVKIVVSNDLDEHAIARLVRCRAPIDVWGVGTRLVTGHDDPALTGVYKLAAYREGDHWHPVMKRSDSPEKTSHPGEKQVYRIVDRHGSPLADLLALAGESIRVDQALEAHPFPRTRRIRLYATSASPLLVPALVRGEILPNRPSLSDIRERAHRDIDRFDPSILALSRPKSYPVLVTPALLALRRHRQGNGKMERTNNG